ncbi:MAG: hypothetical protein A2270_02225 [Elusimicrobia bacterium RIFOXYA12_FULL_51_18]|nr:MAG: hypothetical protein A2270_02225 [Elusimicrobia bacterium RIFOXYA12_FULL_51_18]OGS28334.1 MAG: hypothetical protein A2218_00075 [Elusimicrobia bacterium RIFOXYA2_FULL_53_38]
MTEAGKLSGFPGEKEHLIIFIHDLAPFGAQRVALNIVKYLDKSRFCVTVCSFWGDETLAPELAACGAEVVFLRARRFFDLAAWWGLARLLCRSRQAIVQTNLPELSIPVRLFAVFLSGLKVVHTVQNPFHSEPWYWRFANRITLPLCGAVIFCSRSLREVSGLDSGFPAVRSFVVQNGVGIEAVSASARDELRKEMGVGAEEKLICCVGRLVRQKGQDVLIEAAAILAKEKRRFKIALAGDGEMKEEFQKMSRRAGLEEKILFLGRRADVSRVLSACDIYAAPSRWEGLNISLGEAMLSGKPCVATDIPGHADILENGVTGVAVPAEDAAALAAGIDQALDKPDEAGKLASAALELLRSGFGVAKMAAEYQKLYLELIQNKFSEEPEAVLKRIHVLYFIHDLAPFGAQHSTLYIVRNLNKRRFRVTVCAFWGERTMAPEFQKCGAEVVFLGAARFLDPGAWIRFACFLFRTKPDIIQTNLSELSFPARLLAIFLPRTRVVHIFRNPLHSEPRYWQFLNIMTFGMCDVIGFSSKGIVGEVVGRAPSHKHRLRVMQNGVELGPVSTDARDELRKEMGVGAEEKLICCVGRLVRQKGQDVLIEAAAILAKEKRSFKIALAGDGERKVALQKMAHDAGLEEKILFLGRRADVSRVLSACDIYAAPSRWEAFNIALGEAMLAGKPCVAADIPGHADLLKNGLTGVAVPAEDAAALARGIAGLLDRPSEAGKMASAAERMVRNEFNVDKMAKNFEKLYIEIIREHEKL